MKLDKLNHAARCWSARYYAADQDEKMRLIREELTKESATFVLFLLLKPYKQLREHIKDPCFAEMWHLHLMKFVEEKNQTIFRNKHIVLESQSKIHDVEVWLGYEMYFKYQACVSYIKVARKWRSRSEDAWDNYPEEYEKIKLAFSHIKMFVTNHAIIFSEAELNFFDVVDQYFKTRIRPVEYISVNKMAFQIEKLFENLKMVCLELGVVCGSIHAFWSHSKLEFARLKDGDIHFTELLEEEVDRYQQYFERLKKRVMTRLDSALEIYGTPVCLLYAEFLILLAQLQHADNTAESKRVCYQNALYWLSLGKYLAPVCQSEIRNLCNGKDTLNSSGLNGSIEQKFDEAYQLASKYAGNEREISYKALESAGELKKKFSPGSFKRENGNTFFPFVYPTESEDLFNEQTIVNKIGISIK